MNNISVSQAKKAIVNKLSHYFGVSPETASDMQVYRAVSMLVRDRLAEMNSEFNDAAKNQDSKRVYYLSMEFLMGRSLKNNLYNLGLTETVKEALASMDVKLDSLYEQERDAGLGNGGLGRLAACYLDGLATNGFRSMGYSIRYENGIFQQKIIDGKQLALPDEWLPGGAVWLVKRDEKDRLKEIYFEGSVEESWHGDHHIVNYVDANVITAVPYDMYVSGKGKGVSRLRLWAAKKVDTADDMLDFAAGKHLKAMERGAMAAAISKVLYPADDTPEGKSLRLRQQYFLVSASVQDIIQRHLTHYSTLDNLPEKVAIHINDTHPTMAIPELMRIMLDECDYSWDEAWSIVTRTVAYTNHTVLAEALECWSEELYKRLLPRIYQITQEIDNRFRKYVWDATGDADRVERMAIISNGVVRMANLCVAGSHSVNGVSALHSEILKDTVFNDFFKLTPDKFCNVTNGIAFRRWICQANPRLTEYITSLIGDKFITQSEELLKLKDFANDKKVLAEIAAIKRDNKVRFAKYVKKTTGYDINPDSIFDVQVKRFHEYKRQQLNILNIIAEYQMLKENPNADYYPKTYIFAGKAAPSYDICKSMISLIVALSYIINNDPDVNKKLNVVFIEDYSVTVAELLMPAADISEQISLAGKEASGTGNMKLMLNGAVTLGTLDGANIEINEAVGKDNIFIFGLKTPEVEDLRRSGYYPLNYYNNNEVLRKAVDFIATDVHGKNFDEKTSEAVRKIADYLKFADPYMTLADFADYQKAQKLISETYKDTEKFARMMLMNTSSAGIFSADRAIMEYANNIWHTKPIAFDEKAPSKEAAPKKSTPKKSAPKKSIKRTKKS